MAQVKQRHTLPPELFGEGITVVGEELVQASCHTLPSPPDPGPLHHREETPEPLRLLSCDQRRTHTAARARAAGPSPAALLDLHH